MILVIINMVVRWIMYLSIAKTKHCLIQTTHERITIVNLIAQLLIQHNISPTH